MRLLGLLLLGVVSYLLTMVVFFPIAPVVDRIRPHLGPVALEGVEGKLYKGVINRVRSTDDLLPVELRNVSWALQPQTLFKGGAGLTFGFDGYGGSGQGELIRHWNGALLITDFNFDLQAKALEPLLPVPIATFDGRLSGVIDRISLVNNLLSEVDGRLIWENAELQTPVPTRLGNITVVITPEAGQTHQLSIRAEGGDVSVDGNVTISLAGDFSANVLLTPTPTASPAVINGLRQIGRQDAQGRVRFQRQGNVNRLM